jgi:tryptophanyl-tRNA synthetase
MSKSYGNYIALADDPDTIRSKVMSMITDPQRVRKTDPGRPDYCNVHAYYRVFARDIADEVDEGCRAAAFGCTDCKARLAEILAEFLAPIREKREALLAEEGKVEAILRRGLEKARAVAMGTMEEVWKATDFLRPE